MRNLDFSSWQALLSTLFGLAVITLVGVGMRLLAMQTIQQRRERENRQINERLRTLIAAYKTLGGSFTGNLAVDPSHLGEQRRRQAQAAVDGVLVPTAADGTGSDRARRIRDAVEVALSDIILLGTEEQVRLAAAAAAELTAGRPIHTAALVVSLRDFIRRVLDLDAVPKGLAIPPQGPLRPTSATRRNEGGGGQGGKGGGGLGGGMGNFGGGVADGASHHHDAPHD